MGLGEDALTAALSMTYSREHVLRASSMPRGAGVVVGVVGLGEEMPSTVTLSAARLLAWAMILLGVTALASGQGEPYTKDHAVWCCVTCQQGGLQWLGVHCELMKVRTAAWLCTEEQFKTVPAWRSSAAQA